MGNKTVLLTGGAGFIGSHTCVELIEHGYSVVIADNYSNSFPSVRERIEQLAGPIDAVHEVDLRDRDGLRAVFAAHDIDAVIHFAGKKAVGESFTIPLEYYDVNVGATISLLQVMAEYDVDRLVFSSSCSIYGDGGTGLLREDGPAAPTNPYSRSKLLCEQIMSDAATRYPQLRMLSLRYFNPIGAHPSGQLGEDPRGLPNNVMPLLAQIAVGRLPELKVYGDDYRTHDGTCVRDYVHVVDLAAGHRVALEQLDAVSGHRVMNLGTGVGTSVLDLIQAFEAACGQHIPYRIVGRRAGDVDELIADPARAVLEWGWKAERDLTEMCRDMWRFQSQNPNGYAK
jgi:UDP-glucose 4-epimerase